MNLKEAFRYQNKLQSFLDEAQSILDRDSNVTRVENTYLRHKVMAEAEDETVLAVPETEYYEQITDIARFLLYLLDEKGKLFAAIRKAKSELDIDMDSAVSLNTTRQSIARTFKRMNDLRSSEQMISNGGTGYRFNAEGNQMPGCTGVLYPGVFCIYLECFSETGIHVKRRRIVHLRRNKAQVNFSGSLVSPLIQFAERSADDFAVIIDRRHSPYIAAIRLFWMRQAKRMRIPVQVQMIDNAAHF